MPRALEDSTLIAMPPMHGNQGDRGDAGPASGPAGPTIAISREAGARGETIARRVAKKLGWDVFTREHLEYLAGHETERQAIADDVPPNALVWVERHIARLQRDPAFAKELERDPLPKLIVQLGARGRSLFVGRGAGYLLPKRTTLHVRIIAPPENRIGYMAQYLRLSKAEAAEQVRKRDEMRIGFIGKHYRKRDGEQYDFDMVLNSAELGEETCAELVLAALKAKQP